MAIATIDLGSLDGNNGFRLDGEITFFPLSGLGVSVSDAGDLNGDGFDDVVVGAPGLGSNSSYVVFGKASGFDADFDLSKLYGNNGFRVIGDSHSENAGASVSSAGDINGDGYDDVIISGSNYRGFYQQASSYSYIVFGKGTGFDPVMDLSGVDGENGFRLEYHKITALEGMSASGAGDVNGDGFDDVIIGTNRGVSFVFFGKASGFDANFMLHLVDGNNGFRLEYGD